MWTTPSDCSFTRRHPSSATACDFPLHLVVLRCSFRCVVQDCRRRCLPRGRSFLCCLASPKPVLVWIVAACRAFEGSLGRVNGTVLLCVCLCDSWTTLYLPSTFPPSSRRLLRIRPRLTHSSAVAALSIARHYKHTYHSSTSTDTLPRDLLISSPYRPLTERVSHLRLGNHRTNLQAGRPRCARSLQHGLRRWRVVRKGINAYVHCLAKDAD